MREMLFRGKRIDNGEWVEGESINTQHDYTGKKHIYIGVLFESKMNPKQKNVAWFEVVPETVGQYTGLTDKNGKKIFEGDIVDILTENEEIGIVAYDDGGFLVNADGFCVDFHSNINGTDLEVIGNIRDNLNW